MLRCGGVPMAIRRDAIARVVMMFGCRILAVARPHRLAVRTLGSQPRNRGSIPRGAANYEIAGFAAERATLLRLAAAAFAL